MLHWIPSPAVAFLGARAESSPVLPGDPAHCVQSLRAMHALMLAYAAQRRRAAVERFDSAYWKAAESHALDKARTLRGQAAFGRLP
ncbi:MAG TPA: hypothetical protein VL460_11910 [Caulobacteraceae bacterium]|jgi:hypothetical protein|nr:hypothetical protein [Caulobacteraceae bacterium]